MPPVILSLFAPLFLLFHLVGPAPADLGSHAGQLSPCPGPAHCAEMRFISSDPASTFQALVNLIAQDRSAHVVEQTSDYLHVEVSSAFFGFVDDL